MNEKPRVNYGVQVNEVNVPALGISLITYRMPYLEALKIMTEQNIRIASIEDIALLKISTGINSIITQSHYNVREGCINLPLEKKRILLRDSLTLKNPSEALQAHKEKRSYMPVDFNLNEFLDQIGKENYFVISEDLSNTPGGVEVLTNDFDIHPLTNWMFQSAAKEYGKLIHEFGGRGIIASGDFAYMIDYKKSNSANRITFEYINNPKAFTGSDSQINTLKEYDEEQRTLVTIYPALTGIKYKIS